MALVVVFKDGSEGHWYVQDEVTWNAEQCESIKYIYADGHESEYISEKFVLPFKGGFQRGMAFRLFGDLAKTIVTNLTLHKYFNKVKNVNI